MVDIGWQRKQEEAHQPHRGRRQWVATFMHQLTPALGAHQTGGKLYHSSWQPCSGAASVLVGRALALVLRPVAHLRCVSGQRERERVVLGTLGDGIDVAMQAAHGCHTSQPQAVAHLAVTRAVWAG